MPPTEPRDGKVTIKVWKMILIFLALLMYLSILWTLTALTKVNADPISDPPAYAVISAIIESATTIKSNRFHLSLKYSLKPNPIIFIRVSIINTKENM